MNERLGQYYQIPQLLVGAGANYHIKFALSCELGEITPRNNINIATTDSKTIDNNFTISTESRKLT